MPSKGKNIASLQGVFGPRTPLILAKLETEGISLQSRSTSFAMELGNLLLNYIDFVAGGDAAAIRNKSLWQIEQALAQWREQATQEMHISKEPETSGILFDYRVADKGYYWQDLQSSYSGEMFVHLRNCGRAAWEVNLIGLKEHTQTNTIQMHVAIGQGPDGYIYQIKGRDNTKPLAYKPWITHFLLHHQPIAGFRRANQPEQDFSLCDLDSQDLEIFLRRHPHYTQRDLL